MSLISRSRMTRLEHIRATIAEYKALLKHWQRLETEEVILVADQRKNPDAN